MVKLQLNNVTDSFRLYDTDREDLQSKDQWLNDNHVAVAQLLLKKQFPHITGLQPPVLQQAGPLKALPQGSQSLQILHVDDNHWLAVSTVDSSNDKTEYDITVYDSIYSSISADAKDLLSQLIHTEKPSFNVRLANVSKQTGTEDCGVYAIAYITHIAFGSDPSLYVFRQKDMRKHLLNCLQEKKMTPFATARGKRSLAASRMTVKQVFVYCYCRCTDTGEKMVHCDGNCDEWFHVGCVDCVKITRKKKWYCKTCERVYV